VDETPQKIKLTPEAMTFENIPKEVLDKCEKHGIEIKKIKENLIVFWMIVTFYMPEYFKDYEMMRDKETEWVSDDLIKETIESIPTVSLKSMKKQYKKHCISGEGGFGFVICAKDMDTKELVAIKQLKHEKDKDKMFNWYEVALLKNFNHPNIVIYHKSVNVSDELWIIMEYLHGGTLSEATRVHDFSERHTAYITREILRGIHYLHELNFVHRDLKSGNVMLDINGAVKLIDFGLCASFKEGPRKRMLGSPFWISPEMIKQEEHSYPTDIWSLGVLVLELYTTRPPLYESGIKCMLTVATEGLKQFIPERSCPDGKSFLNKCFEMNPNDRPSSGDLLKHPWINEPGLSAGINKILESIFLNDTLNNIGF